MPTFPDVPGHRFMYDQDGTIVSVSPANAQTPLTVIDGALINDELIDDYAYATNNAEYREITFAFPEARDLTGYFCAGQYNLFNSIALWYSIDTTDGSDGTWVSYGTLTGGHSLNIYNSIRTGIASISGVSGVRGVRFRFNASTGGTRLVGILHLYGNISSALNTDRLEFWEPAANSMLNKMGLDFGDIPGGTSSVKQFRLKNLSTTKTATTIVVTRDNNAGGPTNDAMVTGTQFSLDGTTYNNTVTIGSIPPGGYSVIIYARRIVPVSEAVFPRILRVKATPTTFAAA